MAHGLIEQAERLLVLSRGGVVLNTAFIERLNATFRERLASLTRKSRHAARRLRALETGMYLIGSSYNFCFPHHELSKTTHAGSPCTPAMAAGLTDYVWSLFELLSYRIAPLPGLSPSNEGVPKNQWSPSRGTANVLSFAYARGSYAPPPFSGVLPDDQCMLPLDCGQMHYSRSLTQC